MESLYLRILQHLEDKYELEPLAVPEDVREIKRLGGAFKLNMYNWRMEKIRKISIMRCSIRIPKLDIFAIEMYPESSYDLPLLALDFSKMKKKTFVYINIIPVIGDKKYIKKYVFPLRKIYKKYNIDNNKEPKEWMKSYLTDYSVYAMLDNSNLESAIECAFDYFKYYLKLLDRAKIISNPSYRIRVDTAGLNYCNELSEKDGSRKMLGRFIGMKRANKIFQEVIR